MSKNRRATIIIGALFLGIVWTGSAGGWDDKDCTLGQGYIYTLTRGGWPDKHEGCEEEPDGPVYTDDYGAW